MIYPTVPLQASGPGFKVGEAALFNAFLVRFREQMLAFGVPGKDILAILDGGQASVRPSAPTPDDLDLQGNRIYKFAILSLPRGVPGDSDYVPAVVGTELSDQAFHMLKRKETLWDTYQLKYEADKTALVQYILLECSTSSRATLTTYPAWSKALFSFDYVEMFRLIQLTHLFSSRQSQMRYLREFTNTSQGARQLDPYLGELLAQRELISSAFEEVGNPGFISTDLLFKVVFLIGLNQTAFERPIQKLNEEKPKATLIEAMSFMQAWVRDYGGASLPSSSGHVPRAMVAASDSPSGGGTRGKGSLGSYDPKVHGKFCRFCWDNGFMFPHRVASCRARIGSERDKAQAKEAKAARDSKALVAPVVAMVPTSPSVVSPPVMSRYDQGKATYDLMMEFVRATDGGEEFKTGSRLAIMPPPSSFVNSLVYSVELEAA